MALPLNKITIQLSVQLLSLEAYSLYKVLLLVPFNNVFSVTLSNAYSHRSDTKKWVKEFTFP